MQPFKFPTYERPDVKLLRAYVDNMTVFLRHQNPTLSEAEIESFVKAEVSKSLKRPQMSYINYPSYGNAVLATTDLLTYTDTMRKHIITPAGVLYMRPSKKVSFLKQKINKNKKTRGGQKKAMLMAASVGDLMTEQRMNYQQSSTKIETNSIPGAMGSPHNCLYDIPGYNAVTAVSRHSIMCGYAHVEKLTEGNHYFVTLEHCINYCVQLIQRLPVDILGVVQKHQLYIPSIDDVCVYFIESLRLYMPMTIAIRKRLERFIQTLTTAERIFVYYAYCLKTLMGKNETFFRTFLAEFFRTDVTVDVTVDPKTIFNFNGDLLAMVSSLNADVIERKSVSEAITECPDGVRRLIAIGHHMQEKLDSIGDLIATFLRIDCDTADAMQHKNMIRKAVIISDTDSVIFSTQSWIEWYVGKLSFAKPAYEINSFVVFMITMTLEQVFARLSTNFGAQNEDIFKIAMKNEFLYPLMLRTPLPKQYAGRVSIQEGFVLAKTKNDIKGLSFRSSKFCAETTEAGIAFVMWIFDTVERDGTIKASECIQRTLAHERRVITSLEAGERTFLTSTPVRTADEYKDPDEMKVYCWKLWQEVFKPNFGEFVIPNKGFEIPLLGNGIVLKDPGYLDRVRAYDSALHDRLVRFMQTNPRKITRLVIPMTIKNVPEILRPVIDIRSIVYANSTPFIVTLRSLGLAYTGNKDQTLLSDIYG